MKTELFKIHKAKVYNRRKWWILHLVRLFDDLVTLLSLGYLKSDYYPTLLFSEWAEDIDEEKRPIKMR